MTRPAPPDPDPALVAAFRAICASARAEGRRALTEAEGLAMLEAMGVPTPRRVLVRGSDEFAAMDADIWRPDGERAVLKVMSPEILHKTEAGGVAILPNDRQAILDAMRDMERRFSGMRVDGYTVGEFVKYSPALGNELIFGYRFADDFGPVVSFGPGGIYAEYLAAAFRRGAAGLSLSPAVTDPDGGAARALSHNAMRDLLCGGLRGVKPAIAEAALADMLALFLRAAPSMAAADIAEFEVNPMVVAERAGGRTLVALDCLVLLSDFDARGYARDRHGNPVNAEQETRPVAGIGKILKPESAAIVGVSEKGMNNGRIILRNLLHDGFDPSLIWVVKPDCDAIDGCRCVPDVASLPEKVDLFVVVIPAAAVPPLLKETAESDRAWSVILIPGGLEEKSGTAGIVAEMRAALGAARARGAGPLINGGNCLGIRSRPGKYNTLFIPEYKLPMPKGPAAPLALISQSGAFAITRISKHPDINPRYAITCGNQMDLTVGDYLDYLKDDPEILVYAVYLEGFKKLDGLKTLRAAKAIADSGRAVIFYRAGRTAAGAGAAASHTASIAGDQEVTRDLFTRAGVTVCDTLDRFDDAITLFTLLARRRARGNRLAALSNAGFECVAMADNLGALRLAEFSAETNARLATVFAQARIADIVDVHNPLDLTPMAPDAAYDGGFRHALGDPGADLGIVGIVPFTVMMNSLPAVAASPGVPPEHGEDFTRPDSLVARYGDLARTQDKPFVAVLDTGPLYDAYGQALEARGVPVFRTADRALAMLNLWLASPASGYKDA